MDRIEYNGWYTCGNKLSIYAIKDGRITGVARNGRWTGLGYPCRYSEVNDPQPESFLFPYELMETYK